MTKAQYLLTGTLVLTISGITISYSSTRITKRLFYYTNEFGEFACRTVSSLTTTTDFLNTVSPPIGATGWFTTSTCQGATHRAKTIAD